MKAGGSQNDHPWPGLTLLHHCILEATTLVAGMSVACWTHTPLPPTAMPDTDPDLVNVPDNDLDPDTDADTDPDTDPGTDADTDAYTDPNPDNVS